MFGLNHAMSAPAWEAVDFQVRDAEWVSNPTWFTFPEAYETNKKFTDIVMSEMTSNEAEITNYFEKVEKLSFKQHVGRFIARTPFSSSFNNLLLKRNLRSYPALECTASKITMIYGADSLFTLRIPRDPINTVALEHGTIRWIADGAKDGAIWRKKYKEQLQKVNHVWVTNLDPRTIEIAEEFVPGKWSALPHPFMFDERVPYATDELTRTKLLSELDSEALVLLASSQNWSKHHDKGSIKALEAFIELRKQGVAAGLVAVEWGLQLQESKDLLKAAGVSQFVKWVSPMPRHSLQRMMACVDVVWDQFGLDAFGALALRTLEQGTPLISRGLAPAGEQLIGGPVPWIQAISQEDIVRETTKLFLDIRQRGRSVVMNEYSSNYRKWLDNNHSPQITATLQNHVYSALIHNQFETGSAQPSAWANLINK